MEWNEEIPDPNKTDPNKEDPDQAGPNELREPAIAYGRSKFTIEEYLEAEIYEQTGLLSHALPL
jgi:hypothetical protein